MMFSMDGELVGRYTSSACVKGVNSKWHSCGTGGSRTLEWVHAQLGWRLTLQRQFKRAADEYSSVLTRRRMQK